MGRKITAVLLSTLVFALGGFLWACLSDPVWEVRATLSLDTPEALTALPGMLTGEGASAYAIPGTDVMELALRASSPELAQDKLTHTCAQIPTYLHYLELESEFRTLATAVRCLSRLRPGFSALVGGILGALAALLWLMPAPCHREPLDFGTFLKDLGRAAFHRALPICLTAVILAGGNALRTDLTASPQYSASALIRVGTYDPQSADGLSAALQGLAASQLGDPDITLTRMGKTNLFRISSVSDSETVAISRIASFLDSLPGILSHISGSPGLEIPEAPAVSGPESASLLRSAALGAGLGIALWLCALTAQICRKPQTCIP